MLFLEHHIREGIAEGDTAVVEGLDDSLDEILVGEAALSSAAVPEAGREHAVE